MPTQQSKQARTTEKLADAYSGIFLSLGPNTLDTMNLELTLPPLANLETVGVSKMKAYVLAGMILLGLATAFAAVSFFPHTVQANGSGDN